MAGALALAAAVLIWRRPAAGLAAVLAQLVAFLGVLALVAYGFLAPFDPMCAHDWDPFTWSDVFR